jgi:2-phospho-L-lactate guanylyltransferase
MATILIPVKRLDEAKQRLADHLSPENRRRLGLAMLADVLRATDKWPARWIVTSDPDAEAVGLGFGCRLLQDGGLGLNEALKEALAVATAEDVETLLILPSDVPLVTTEDLKALLATDAAVVIAPSQSGGTNALLLRPPDAIEPSFGPNSASLHATAAARKGLHALMLRAPSLALDIDEPRHLVALASATSKRESVRIAKSLLEGN